MYELFPVTGQKTNPFVLTLMVDGVKLPMEIDTGASVSIISENTFKSSWPGKTAPVLEHAKARLRTYSREELEVLGKIHVNVCYQNQHKAMELLVVKNEGPTFWQRLDEENCTGLEGAQSCQLCAELSVAANSGL